MTGPSPSPPSQSDRACRTTAGAALPARYDSIDLARGLAALAILIWHYQHFTVGGLDTGSRAAYPLYALLWPFYDHGAIAVDFFWIVSGFVFAAVYADRAIGGKAFFWHRFGRLYPLHLLTLLIVAGLQWVARQRFGGDLIYSSHQPLDFAMQLAMASGWTLPTSYTFNGPIWSVSAEVLVYAMFWFLRGHLFRWGILLPLLIAVVGLVFQRWNVAACVAFFFLGTAIYDVHRRHQLKVQLLLGGFGIALCLLLAITGSGSLARIAGFASVVTLLAAADQAGWGRHAARVPWLADNCYSSYLLHIPVQLVILIVVGAVGAPLFESGWFLLFYLTVVTVVARFSFVAFERPARRWVRVHLAGDNPKQPPTLADAARAVHS